MEKSTVKEYATRYVGDVDVYRAVKDGMVYVTEPDNLDRTVEESWDFCGKSVVDTRTFEVHPCCDFCGSDNGYRVADSLRAAADYGDVDSAAVTLSKRMDIAGLVSGGLYGLRADRGVVGADYIVVSEGDSSPGDGHAYYDALYILGQCQSWQIGVISLEDVADLEELRVSDCSDTVCGVVWENVDRDGDSSPSHEELANAYI